MTLAEKLHFLILKTRPGRIENINEGIPRLCIPPLTLQDGPAGPSFGARRVTQLPSPLALAASFDTALAARYGAVVGAEARAKGIDVVQGPDLNLDRVPASGRGFEAFGEDPLLTGALGTAVTEGIQSTGVMAQLKHFAVYNQETARMVLDQKVPTRALEELYFRPFEMAVAAAHPASIMCEYGSVNGVNGCQSLALFKELQTWGFSGFIRSDLRSVTHPVAAFKAGLDLIKPGSFTALRSAVRTGALPVTVVDTAVEKVLAPMFALGMVAHPRKLDPGAAADSAAHAAEALSVAEHAIVLLKNRSSLLPLGSGGGSGRLASIAVVGPGAGRRAMTAGYGSAYVPGERHPSPLAAIRALAPRGTVVRAADTLPVATVPLPASDFLHGTPLPPGPPAFDERGEHEFQDFDPIGIPRADLTAAAPSTGEYWHTWTATVAVRVSGLYALSLVSSGDCFMSVDGTQVFADRGLHARSEWSFPVRLVGGRPTVLSLRWYSRPGLPAPAMTWADETPSIQAAVAAARVSSAAVVVVDDWSSEGSDRPNLDLLGAENALVSAVSAVNPNTVVVLSTGGPVLMPWLPHVAAVLAAWYGGEESGRAMADVLFGRFDPSGHLPVTFPRSADQGVTSTAAAYPGVAGTVVYGEGLDIGYRYFEAHGQTPLFPFGFGLSYTTFSLSALHVAPAPGGGAWAVSLEVSNTGPRTGGTVVQAYVSFPSGFGEPPHQLAAFSPVTLRPGQSKRVVLELPRRDFEAFLHGGFSTVPGSYVISLGQSSASLPLHATVRAPA